MYLDTDFASFIDFPPKNNQNNAIFVGKTPISQFLDNVRVHVCRRGKHWNVRR